MLWFGSIYTKLWLDDICEAMIGYYDWIFCEAMIG